MCVLLILPFSACVKKGEGNTPEESTTQPVKYNGEKIAEECYETNFIGYVLNILFEDEAEKSFTLTLHCKDVLDNNIASVFTVWQNENEKCRIALSADNKKVYLCENLSSIDFYSLNVDTQKNTVEKGEKAHRNSYSQESFPYEAVKYNALENSQKAFYNELYGKIKNLEDFSFDLENVGYDGVNSAFLIYKSIMYDHPEIENYFQSVTYSNDEYKTSFSSKYFFIEKNENITDRNEEIKEEQRKFEAKCDEIVGSMADYLCTYDKYFYLARSITELCDYSYNFDENNKVKSPYGALIVGSASCEGYSRAYQYLCSKANLYCICIGGKANGEGHRWNMIKLDDGTYYVDVTWCDTATDWFKYFALSADEMLKNHILDDDETNLATGTKYTYSKRGSL